jgi:feruloyl esterase
MKWSEVFGESITIRWQDKGKPENIEDPTLLQALQANGGGMNALARHSVANLLNSVIPGPYPPSCSELAALSLPNVTIVSAVEVAAEGDTPAHCEVEGVIDVEIGFNVKIPGEADWNGKMFMHGNGGFAGSFQHQFVNSGPIPLERGYAAVETDTGHKGASSIDGAPFLDNWERVVSFAYRAVHLSTVTAKTLIRAYFDRDIDYAYFQGCSTGGRQAMVESQRYPHDYDGIIVGAPAYDLASIAHWADSQSMLFPDPDDFTDQTLPLSKLGLLETSILDACDGLDLIEDGILNDPRDCPFDYATDLPMCAGDVDPGDDSCFTTAEVDMIDLIYARTDTPFYGDWSVGYPYGGEDELGGWVWWVVGGPALGFTFNGFPNIQYAFAADYFKYIFYNDPQYNLNDFDSSTDQDDLTPVVSIVSATETDLTAFKDHGGRMLMYTGWSDPALSALNTVEYYEAMVETMGGAESAADFNRLFMLPGVLHCSGGPGPDSVDYLAAMEEWVENGVAPDNLMASHSSGMTRPLCPYPEVAVWDETGDPNVAESFFCADPSAF